MKLTQLQWEKVLNRWCGVTSPEAKLCCAALAAAIYEEPDDAKEYERQVYSDQFRRQIDPWCRVLGLSTQNIMEQINRAQDFNRHA